MKVTILDYKDRRREVEVGELESIRKMYVDVITGDEILVVVYDDNTIKRFDSSDDRTRDFYDGNYKLFERNDVDELNNPEWLNRTHYDYLYEHGDRSDADPSDWW